MEAKRYLGGRQRNQRGGRNPEAGGGEEQNRLVYRGLTTRQGNRNSGSHDLKEMLGGGGGELNGGDHIRGIRALRFQFGVGGRLGSRLFFKQRLEGELKHITGDPLTSGVRAILQTTDVFRGSRV